MLSRDLLGLTEEKLHLVFRNGPSIKVAKDNDWRGHLTETERFCGVGKSVVWVRGSRSDLASDLAICQHLCGDYICSPIGS